MKASTHRFNRPVWFKKWNRKAYSMFRSLGVVVHISRLSASVADQSLLKTSSARLAAVFQSPTDCGTTNKLAEPLDELLPTCTIMEQSLFAAQAVHACSPQAVARTFDFYCLFFCSRYKGLVPVSLSFGRTRNQPFLFFAQ